MGRHDGAYDALLGEYLAGTLALPLRVLLESHLELRASVRSRGAAREITVRDPELARLFGFVVAGEQPARRRTGDRDDGVRVEEARLPRALRDFFGADLARLPWQSSPGGGRISTTGVIEGCNLTLLWLAPGEARLRHPRPVPELTLVLEGGVRDDEGLWQAGDVSLRGRHGCLFQLVAGEAGCLLLLVSDTTRTEKTGPLARLFDAVLDQLRLVGGVLRCLCCRPV